MKGSSVFPPHWRVGRNITIIGCGDALEGIRRCQVGRNEIWRMCPLPVAWIVVPIAEQHDELRGRPRPIVVRVAEEPPNSLLIHEAAVELVINVLYIDNGRAVILYGATVGSQSLGLR